jgi:hypothetical protein
VCWPYTVSTLLLLGTVIVLPESRPDLGEGWPSRLVATPQTFLAIAVSRAYNVLCPLTELFC